MTKKMPKAFVLKLFCLYEVVMLLASAPVSTAEYLPKVDTHSHIIPAFYKDLLATYNRSPGPPWNVDAHLAMMETFNIVTSVISAIIPGAKLVKDEPVEIGRNLARELNLYTKNLTVAYPKKFLFFATLTLPDVEGAVAEAIYALDTLGAVGVILQANVFGELLGTRRYDPLYEVLNDRKAVVFIHPSNTPCPNSAPDDPLSVLIPSVAGFLLDTVHAASELVVTGVTTDFPDITFTLSHSGGFLPFAATRIANALSTSTSGGEADVIYEKLSQYSADLAISTTRTALPSTLAFFDESKLTYGTDYPFLIISVEDSALSFENPPVPLSEEVVEKFTIGNAYNLYKKFLV